MKIKRLHKDAILPRYGTAWRKLILNMNIEPRLKKTLKLKQNSMVIMKIG